MDFLEEKTDIKNIQTYSVLYTVIQIKKLEMVIFNTTGANSQKVVTVISLSSL